MTMKKKKNYSKRNKIVKEIIKAFIIIIVIVVVVLHIFYNRVSRMTPGVPCSNYGTSWKMIKVEKRYYCCIKTDEGDYNGCLRLDDEP